MNNFINIMYKTIASGLYSYRKKLPFVMSANRDFSSEAAEKNDVINVPISKAKTTSDVVPSGLRSNTLPSSSQEKVQIHLKIEL